MDLMIQMDPFQLRIIYDLFAKSQGIKLGILKLRVHLEEGQTLFFKA